MVEQLVWTPEQERLLDIKKTNYGVSGVHYIKWLVRNREYAKQVLETIETEVKERFHMSNDERFWLSGVVAILAGIQLASEAGVFGRTIKSGPIVEYLRSRVIAMRTIVRASCRKADDILSSFLSTFAAFFKTSDFGRSGCSYPTNVMSCRAPKRWHIGMRRSSSLII